MYTQHFDDVRKEVQRWVEQMVNTLTDHNNSNHMTAVELLLQECFFRVEYTYLHDMRLCMFII